MTNEQLARLKEAAEKATPGHWEWRKIEGWDAYELCAGERTILDDGSACGEYRATIAHDGDDAAFIALAKPSAIASLLERLREAETLIAAAFKHTRHPTSAEAEWRDRARAHMEKYDVK